MLLRNNSYPICSQKAEYDPITFTFSHTRANNRLGKKIIQSISCFRSINQYFYNQDDYSFRLCS